MKYKNSVSDDCKDINEEIEFSNNENSDNNSVLNSNDNDDDDGMENKKENNLTIGNIPFKALLNGLYCGPIPEELKDLNFVEISMISINNPVTKIRVEG